MKDYSKGKIYKLISNQSDDIYYGSTIQPLSSRMSNHKKDYKRYINNKFHYMTSYEILKYNDCRIILIENYPCTNLEELNAREQYYIDTYECINKQRAYRSEEYKKIERKINNAKYKENNKEKLEQYNKDYNKTYRNKEIFCKFCNKTYTMDTIYKHNKTNKHIFNFINF